MEGMEQKGEKVREAEPDRPEGRPRVGSQDGTDPCGGRRPTQPTPKPEVAENTMPYSPARGTFHGGRRRAGQRSRPNARCRTSERFTPPKHRGTAERERSTAPELQ